MANTTSTTRNTKIAPGEWGFKSGEGTTVARIWKVYPVTNPKRIQEFQLHVKSANEEWESQKLPISKFYQYDNPNTYQLGLINAAKESYKKWSIPISDNIDQENTTASIVQARQKQNPKNRITLHNTTAALSSSDENVNPQVYNMIINIA